MSKLENVHSLGSWDFHGNVCIKCKPCLYNDMPHVGARENEIDLGKNSQDYCWMDMLANIVNL